MFVEYCHLLLINHYNSGHVSAFKECLVSIIVRFNVRSVLVVWCFYVRSVLVVWYFYVRIVLVVWYFFILFISI